MILYGLMKLERHTFLSKQAGPYNKGQRHPFGSGFCFDFRESFWVSINIINLP